MLPGSVLGLPVRVILKRPGPGYSKSGLILFSEQAYPADNA